MKIRTDFVTNSSSTSYMVFLRKKGTDKEILKELEKLGGYGPKGAQETFDVLMKCDDEYSVKEYLADHPEVTSEGCVGAYILTSDTDGGVPISHAIANKVIKEIEGNKTKPTTFEIITVGEED